jgi:serine/threonine protein kinase
MKYKLKNDKKQYGGDPDNPSKKRKTESDLSINLSAINTEEPLSPKQNYIVHHIENNPVIVGQGSYGKVYKITNKQLVLAVKVLDLSNSKNDQMQIGNEIEILKELKNSCNEYFLCYDDDFIHNNKHYIVTEYVGEELFNLLTENKISDGMVDIITNHLVNAIQKLHQLNYIHRDIKLENILVNSTNNSIKIIDFGEACRINECGGVRGTSFYLAPELINGIVPDNYDYTKADIWACGVTIFILVFKNYPFDDTTSTLNKNPNYPQDITPIQCKYIYLLNNIFQKQPEYRWTIDQIKSEVDRISMIPDDPDL